MIDERGNKYGDRTVLDTEPRLFGDGRGYYWECECKCGERKWINGTFLRRGKADRCKSCGALRCKGGRISHAQSRTDYYQYWASIKNQCKRSKIYNLHPPWNDFVSFRSDIGYRPSKEYVLRRINEDKDFEPGNVIWVKKTETGLLIKREISTTRVSKKENSIPRGWGMIT